jgi:hypothetical protein
MNIAKKSLLPNTDALESIATKAPGHKAKHSANIHL